MLEVPTYASVKNEYGLDHVDFRDCSTLTAMKSTLLTEFDLQYTTRHINATDPALWQARLQRTFDWVGPRYDRALLQYVVNKEKMDTEILAYNKTIRESDVAMGGSDRLTTSSAGTTSYVAKTIDTPDVATNLNENYADARSTNDGTTTNNGSNQTEYGQTQHTEDTVTSEMAPDSVLEALNRNIDAWRNLRMQFVNEFQNCFLNIFDDSDIEVF